MLFQKMLHKLVAFPVVYDLSQWLAGASVSRQIFREEFAKLPCHGRVLDVGGGTGLIRPLLPAAWSYCCLDPDPQKLEGFRVKFPHDESLECSACKMLLPDESFDLCIMCAVSHHLTDEDFGRALKEIKRVLRPGGNFMLMDAVWNPANLRGRFLWSVDRGSFPKAASALESHLEDHLRIDRRRIWKVHHEYALYWCRKD
jgi:ubiquinone/menaquinone biosynthesis C-methylase UbiE